MPDKQNFNKKDIRGSEFRSVNMSGSVFNSVDLSGSEFFDINLRNAKIGAVDFGGTSFSCMNTGEGFPMKPAEFNNVELDNCTMRNCYFRNTKLVACDITGMTIDGVALTDIIKAYKAQNKITDEMPSLEGEILTKSALANKRFSFQYIEDNEREKQNGTLVLNSDGTIGEYSNPNEHKWEIDKAGRLIFLSEDGRISSVFNKVSINKNRYELRGLFMLYGEIIHILREL
jgi:uncharacterized protein YjbI with pentapeptide repeats